MTTFKNIGVLILATVFLWLLVCGLHGCYCDFVRDALHDDCNMCETYRYAHADDAAFQIREMRRNRK